MSGDQTAEVIVIDDDSPEENSAETTADANGLVKNPFALKKQQMQAKNKVVNPCQTITNKPKGALRLLLKDKPKSQPKDFKVVLLDQGRQQKSVPFKKPQEPVTQQKPQQAKQVQAPQQALQAKKNTENPKQAGKEQQQQPQKTSKEPERKQEVQQQKPMPSATSEDVDVVPSLTRPKRPGIQTDENYGLLGVEYVIKIKKSDADPAPMYECGLCELVLDAITMQRHLECYNHRLKYCEKHYPTAMRHFRQVMHRVPEFEIFKVMYPVVTKLAMAIEEHYGRSKPYECYESEYKKNRMQILSKAFSCKHASETHGTTFIHVVDAQEIDRLIQNRHTFRCRSSTTPTAIFDSDLGKEKSADIVINKKKRNRSKNKNRRNSLNNNLNISNNDNNKNNSHNIVVPHNNNMQSTSNPQMHWQNMPNNGHMQQQQQQYPLRGMSVPPINWPMAPNNGYFGQQQYHHPLMLPTPTAAQPIVNRASFENQARYQNQMYGPPIRQPPPPIYSTNERFSQEQQAIAATSSRRPPSVHVIEDDDNSSGGGGEPLYNASYYVTARREVENAKLSIIKEMLDDYHMLVERETSKLNSLYEGYRKNPTTLPDYNEEWKLFWKKRKLELLEMGIDHHTYNFQNDWLVYIKKRLEILYDKDMSVLMKKMLEHKRRILDNSSDDYSQLDRNH